jgi:hypothetical protein
MKFVKNVFKHADGPFRSYGTFDIHACTITFSFASCVAPLNPYQSKHVMTFYNFPKQGTRY